VKISIAPILRDHFATLCHDGESKISPLDIVVFYLLPIALGIWAYVSRLRLEKDVYNVSITFFGIFLALLLNLQVAIFAIFQRKWTTPDDSRLIEMQKDRLQGRRQLLGELNANISYLTMISCISLSGMLIFHIQQMVSGWQPAFTVTLYAHFLVTLLMIIKRSHALFQKEYRDSPE
jgi:hypothetical protein